MTIRLGGELAEDGVEVGAPGKELIAGPAAAGLVSGSFVIESLFDVPGMGRLFVTAIINRDVMLILGTTVVYAVALLFLNLAADLANAALNPKVARSR
jgi:oligopeptide transport system permease protein